jgi:hypothetical protein
MVLACKEVGEQMYLKEAGSTKPEIRKKFSDNCKIISHNKVVSLSER